MNETTYFSGKNEFNSSTLSIILSYVLYVPVAIILCFFIFVFISAETWLQILFFFLVLISFVSISIKRDYYYCLTNEALYKKRVIGNKVLSKFPLKDVKKVEFNNETMKQRGDLGVNIIFKNSKEKEIRMNFESEKVSKICDLLKSKSIRVSNQIRRGSSLHAKLEMIIK